MGARVDELLLKAWNNGIQDRPLPSIFKNLTTELRCWVFLTSSRDAREFCFVFFFSNKLFGYTNFNCLLQANVPTPIGWLYDYRSRKLEFLWRGHTIIQKLLLPWWLQTFQDYQDPSLCRQKCHDSTSTIQSWEFKKQDKKKKKNPQSPASRSVHTDRWPPRSNQPRCPGCEKPVQRKGLSTSLQGYRGLPREISLVW